MNDTKLTPTDYEIEFSTFHGAEAITTTGEDIAKEITQAARDCLESRDMTSKEAERYFALAKDEDFLRFIQNEINAAIMGATLPKSPEQRAAEDTSSRAAQMVELYRAGEITALDLSARLQYLERWAAQEVADAVTDQYRANWQEERNAALLVLDGQWLNGEIKRAMARQTRITVNEYYEKHLQPVEDAIDLRSPEDQLPDNFYIDEGIGHDCKKLIDAAAILNENLKDAEFFRSETFDSVYRQMMVWYFG